jgi:sRNA-binding carbon storage regulator CsrA
MGDVQSSLTVDVRMGERLCLSSAAEVSIELIRKSGQLARLRFTAPREVKIEKKVPYCQQHKTDES